MNVDFKKLKSFVKVVDAGSVSRAAGILRTAQPALSHQIAALETHFKHKLLIRSNHGITPTEAGRILYRHAQALLKQIEQARVDMDLSAGSVAGRVSIGLATYSSSSALSLPLLKAMKERHPQIVVHINDSFGHVLSELIMIGKMDMAVIYGSGPIKGVAMQPLFSEELVLVSPPGTYPEASNDPLPLSALADVDLLLPSSGHFLRRVIDEGLARARINPRVASEIESVSSLGAAVLDGLGATILPGSVASSSQSFNGARVRRLVRPAMTAAVSLCVSDHLPLSEPALAARSVLLDLVGRLAQDASWRLKPVA
ncbi:nitrogen assimilation transcriptional regulator NAC [Terrarubrum flagellatum]|uniref:nitrogen assimilation transcriptional regulator NAC n=1 Tax=Terrirubrum flagellatum TaxID=2895980 RepID=UPI0031450410